MCIVWSYNSYPSLSIILIFEYRFAEYAGAFIAKWRGTRLVDNPAGILMEFDDVINLVWDYVAYDSWSLCYFKVDYSDLERASASRAQLLGHIGVSPSSNSEVSDTRTGVSDGSSDSAGNSIADGRKLGFQLDICSPVHSFCGSLWTPGQDNEWFSDRDHISRSTSSNVQQESKGTQS